MTGYGVSLPGDVNKQGEPVWYADYALSGDLSLPQVHKRLTTTTPEPVTVLPGSPWNQATAATERIFDHLTHSEEGVAQGRLAALGGVLDLLHVTAQTAARAELEQAAMAFERATRSRHDPARSRRMGLHQAYRGGAPDVSPVTGQAGSPICAVDQRPARPPVSPAIGEFVPATPG
ncbi:hypothetical protein AB9Q10_11880 [Streptomyces krungchingensis]|uniref:hypothetical protein n=1 Tax=Streptomyces krungchingensis TaxID=1565034 RepID=UPI003CE6E4CC